MLELINCLAIIELIEPSVMPLNSLGVVDIEGIGISDTELMAHALSNCVDRNPANDFSVRRGSAFVNEYARLDAEGQRTDGGPGTPNHLLGCFPTLFPYGLGGFEVPRRVNVPYETHIRWAIRYADKHFRRDYHFPFQVFGVIQKRQVCRSTILQIRRPSFLAQKNLISRLTPTELVAASREETRGVPYSNLGVRALRKQLSAVRTRVDGTDESRQSVRSKIWSTNLIHNPPNLWITINPADTHDPIAQVMTGAMIDLDNFCRTASPDHEDRATNIALDPYAAAKFFHFIIKAIFEQLFGITKTGDGHIQRHEGILGMVKSYIGTVEAQGRGTLHLHLLLWLMHAPSSAEMQRALTSDDFRSKIQGYIKTVIRADIHNFNTASILSHIPKESGISYSRPLDPRVIGEAELELQENKLARAVQLHQCSSTTCLKMVSGRLQCKRGAPFPLSHAEWVKESGDWGPKRFCAYLNSWNSTLMRCLRANHDLKLIMNGAETSMITWYITNYATKKQTRSSNVSALLAKRLAFHKLEEAKEADLTALNRRLIQRCANALTRDREFSILEIISYLMGWGDRYESHLYTNIYWDSVEGTLKRIFPELRRNL